MVTVGHLRIVAGVARGKWGTRPEAALDRNGNAGFPAKGHHSDDRGGVIDPGCGLGDAVDGSVVTSASADTIQNRGAAHRAVDVGNSPAIGRKWNPKSESALGVSPPPVWMRAQRNNRLALRHCHHPGRPGIGCERFAIPFGVNCEMRRFRRG